MPTQINNVNSSDSWLTSLLEQTHTIDIKQNYSSTSVLLKPNGSKQQENI